MQAKSLNQRPRTLPRPSEGNEGNRPDQNVSAFLVIPYFNNDMGRQGIERPLNASIVSWLCPSVIVNGEPGKNNFIRGADTTVTVDVANWGSGTLSTPVYVRVWWSDPSTGFTTLNLFGQSTVAAPTGGGVRRTQPIVGIIPASAPAHVCLLVNIWSPLEATSSSTIVNPTNDRHWAQLNINDVSATIGRPFKFIFWAGNPLKRAATFEIAVRSVAREAIPMLERVQRAETMRVERLSVQLRELRYFNDAAAVFGGVRRETSLTTRLKMPQLETGGLNERVRQELARRSQCRITLQPGERLPIQLIGELPSDTPPGTRTVIEIVSIGLGDHEQEVFGSLGLIVTALERR